MTKPAVLLKVAMIPCLMLSTACAPAKPVLILPPAYLAECADEPVAPALRGVAQPERDLLTLDYILGLRSAWGDCKAKTDGLRAWMDAAS